MTRPTPTASPFWKQPKVICFALTLMAGLILLWPGLDFQDWLSTGDHGRDLDAFEQAMHGKMVYTDYWWVYGPLMPFYYALFYKFLGISIHSVLVGKFLIKLTAGLLCYLALATLFQPITALAGALWFWGFQQDFFFTYNHIGGITVIMGIVWCLLSYIKAPRLNVLWWGVGLCFVLAMIKVNFGLSSLGALMAAAFIVDWSYKVPFSSPKKLFYFTGFILFPAVVVFVYWLLLKPLPMYEIRQCLPYSNADQPYNTMPWTAMWSFLQIEWGEAKKSPVLLIFYGLMLLCGIQATIVLAKNKIDGKRKKIILLSLSVLAIYGVCNFHEFLKSGVWYRWFWAQPPLIALTFIVFETAAANLHKVIRLLLWSSVLVMVFITGLNSWQSAIHFHDPAQKIEGPRGGIYVANPNDWVQTVNTTVQYINKTVPPGEQFFAVPYDVLYYYLTGRPAPSRQTIFFEHINIPKEQEFKIIKELEDKHVNWVLLSNRFMSPERGLGILGHSYCPVLGKYIDDHYKPLVRIGDWQHVPGWGWSHGTMIWQRK
jgi:hypothetical protein